MKIVCLLLLAFCTVSFGGKTHKCSGKEKGRVKQFSNDGIYVNFPCKYHALKRQQCGKYRITLTPGTLWLSNNYYWNTMWLGIVDSTDDKGWEARTTNKIVVKHYNSSGEKPLFNKKGGNLNTSIFETGFVKSGKAEAYIKIDGVFELRINPWDPYNRRKYPHPSWEFECFDEEATLNNFTDGQVCGGSIKDEVQKRAKDVFGLGKSHKDFVIYHDVFMSDVEQTDDECIEASNLVQSCGDQARRLLVLRNCMDILYKVRHASCVTSYLCNPMQAFNRCLKWGCFNETAFDKDADDLCYDVGEAIDLCGDISGPGNITARMKAANCFKEYLTITYDD